MDEELIVKAKLGEIDAFTDLIHTIENDLYRIAKTRLEYDDDICDAIQETMINAYKHLKKLNDNSNFKSWIIKILINECNKIYKNKKKKEKLYTKIITKESTTSIDESTYLVDSKINFELLIENLQYEDKLILTLFYCSGYSCTEISKIIGLNINTVKSKLKRSKDKIKKCFEGGFFYEK